MTDPYAYKHRQYGLQFAIELARARGDGTDAAKIISEAKLIEAYLRGDAKDGSDNFGATTPVSDRNG